MPVHRPHHRAGIIGTGVIAHAHADALAELSPRVELVAVADVDPARAAAFATRHAVDSVHTDAQRMLELENLDLVLVCTPPWTHASLAAAGMLAGVPVILEKPPALSLCELDELAEIQARTGIPTLTVFQHRFGAGAVRLRRMVDAGLLGRPLVATCETLWFRPNEYFDEPWRGRWEFEGGGPTVGHGIHQFDLMLSVLGPWALVTALAERQVRPTDTEDVSVAAVRFDNGALATVVNSLLSPQQTSRLRFDFEHATVTLEHLYGYDDRDWTFSPAPGHERLAELWAAGPPSDVASGHRSQLESILDAFDSGAEPGVSLADARRTMELAAAIYASAFRGRAIAAGEIDKDDPFSRSMDGGVAPWPRIKVAPA